MCKKVENLPDDYSLAKMAFDKAIVEFNRIAEEIEDVRHIENSKGSDTRLGISKLDDYISTFSDEAYNVKYGSKE